MSRGKPWLSFERRGGAAPPDDEALALAEDGSFTALRTIGGRRIGTFGGRLPATAMRGLRRSVEGVSDAHDLTLPTPDRGATEQLEVAGRRLELGSNESPPKPWRPLLERVRELLTDEVVESPAAAIELVADSRHARLGHAGDAPVDIDVGSLAVRVVRVADEGGILGRWNGRPAEGLVDNGERLVPTSRWVTADPGWSVTLPFDHPLELAPGDMLQVWVDVPLRDGDRERDGRLYVPVAADD